MAKITLTIIANRPNRHGEYVVHLQISSNLKTLRVPTDVTVTKDNWLKKDGQVKSGRDGDPLAANKNVRLTQIKNGCEVKIMNNQERVNKMDVYALRKFLLSEKEVVDTNFFSYSKLKEEHCFSMGRKKTAELLRCATEKVRDFWGDKNLDFTEITVSFLEKFEAYCLRTPIKVYGKKSDTEITHKMSLNGVAVYMRYIRSIINGAIDDELTDKYPFKKYKIKTEPTKNRNLSLEAIRAIRDYQHKSVLEEITRDVFILQFCLQGINLIDLFWMTPQNLIEGRLQYYRRKSRGRKPRFCNAKVEPEAQCIIDKYKGEKYLLWFADYNGEERKETRTKHARKSKLQYKDESAFTKMINGQLEIIQKELNINPASKITDYFVRHSFASILREIGVSIDDISLSMAHRPPAQKVTGIYINEDFIKADIANRKLIDHLNSDIVPVNNVKNGKKQPPATRTRGSKLTV